MSRLFFALLAASAVMLAQNTIGLHGKVTDPQGNSVPGAQVQLFGQDSTPLVKVSTPDSGLYSFEGLSSGNLLVEVQKDGFRTTTVNVMVERGSTKELNVSLQVEGVKQQVTVTASGVAQLENEISKALSVVDVEEIQARNATQLADVIRYTPGLQIRNGGGIGQFTSFRVRGLRPDATAVLVDGLRFRDGSTPQSDASSFIETLNFVNSSRVEVLRGSGSSLYGTNAVGGAINVVTSQGGGARHSEFQAEAGNMGLYRGRLTQSGGAFRDRLKYSGGLLALNVTKGIDGNDATRNNGGQGFVKYELTPRMSISNRIWGSDDFLQLNNGPTVAFIPAANIPATGVILGIPLPEDQKAILVAGGTPNYGNATYVPHRDHPNNRRSSWSFTNATIFKHALSDNANWQASFQRVHTNRIFESWTGAPLALNYGNYVGDVDTFDIHLTDQVKPWLRLTGGYEFERERYIDHLDNNKPAPGRVISGLNVPQRANAGYFASQFSLLGQRLQISLSGRAQGFSLSAPTLDAVGATNVYSGVSISGPPKALTGDVSVAYFIPKSNTKLRAHMGNAYRAPSLYERFGGGFYTTPATGLIGFTPYGQPALAPDRYNSVDGGLDQYFFKEKLRASLTYFYTRIVQITAFDSSGSVVNAASDRFGRTAGYFVGPGGISRGFELGLEARPTRTLTMNGSYTYTNADSDRDVVVTGFYKVFGTAAHTATLAATKQWTNRLDTTFTLFRSGVHYWNTFAVNRARAFEIPGYTNAGLMVSYAIFKGEEKQVRLYTKIDNVFNRRYYEQGYLAAGPAAVAGLRYSF
ncbi:MAG: TonB-dependent receptor [Bryobacteraceae bacterium]